MFGPVGPCSGRGVKVGVHYIATPHDFSKNKVFLILLQKTVANFFVSWLGGTFITNHYQTSFTETINGQFLLADFITKTY
jgi:hypothetical protein